VSIFLPLAALMLNSCTLEKSVNEDIFAKQEEVSSALLQKRFPDLEALERYLDGQGVKYLLETDPIGKEPPKDPAISWDKDSAMYYLVLLPRNQEKLYRFRVYPVGARVLYVEADFGYKNPYQ
jgi:hypothetical protein